MRQATSPRHLPRQSINRRAWVCAQHAYARYRDELHAAVVEGAVPITEIEAWLPAERRDGEPKGGC